MNKLTKVDPVEEVVGELVQDESKALIPAPQQLAQWFPVVAQDWEESERGWGTRPDGYTLHLSMNDRDAFVERYYAEHNNLDEAPDEYTRVCGSPSVIDVGPQTYRKLREQKALERNGIWGPEYSEENYNPHTKLTRTIKGHRVMPKSRVLP